jgi:3-deoxy-7-phosphoheptulonate synthase
MEWSMNIGQQNAMVLPSPGEIRRALPATPQEVLQVQLWRKSIADILSKKDPRLLIIIGPCAVQRADATVEYALRLQTVSKKFSDQFFIVMRSYVEKSRSAADWKGFLYTQRGPNSLQEGVLEARNLFLHLIRAGVPIAMEFLDPLAADYLSDLVSWGCIGARTVQSPIHRELASRLSMPVGMKNTTDGSMDVAVNAVAAAGKSHLSFGIGEDGRVSQVVSRGNPHAHLVLRGGVFGPNYHPPQIQKAADLLRRAGLSDAIVVDCSHGNSQKKWERQPEIFLEVLQARLSSPSSPIRGLMVESFLLEGTQEKQLKDHPADGSEDAVRYGASPVDGCLGWDGTAALLNSAHERCCRMKECAIS